MIKSLLKQSSQVMIVRLISMMASIILSIKLANILGPEGVGEIQLLLKISTYLLLFAVMGADTLVTKTTAVIVENSASRDYDYFSVSLRSGGFLSLVVLFFTWLSSDSLVTYVFQGISKNSLQLILLSLPIDVIAFIISGRLLGKSLNWQSQLNHKGLLPLVVLTIILVSPLTPYILSPNRVIWIYVVGKAFVLTMMIVINTNNRMPGQNIQAGFKKYFTKIPSLWSYFLVNLSRIVSGSIDIVFLGVFEPLSIVGLYAVATRVTLVPGLIISSVNTVLSPKVAILVKKGSLREMRFELLKLRKFLFILGVLIVVTMALFGRYVLGLWGEDFIEGYPVMIVLIIGQFFNITTGPAGVVLLMSNMEKQRRNISLIKLFLQIFLLIILVPSLGLIGAALATSIAVIISNLLMLYYSNKLLKYN